MAGTQTYFTARTVLRLIECHRTYCYTCLGLMRFACMFCLSDMIAQKTHGNGKTPL
jgi:hypothetical protein